MSLVELLLTALSLVLFVLACVVAWAQAREMREIEQNLRDMRASIKELDAVLEARIAEAEATPTVPAPVDAEDDDARTVVFPRSTLAPRGGSPDEGGSRS